MSKLVYLVGMAVLFACGRSELDGNVALVADSVPQPDGRPAPPVGGVPAVALAIGDHHSCVVLSNGSVRCIGDNSAGQLGDGTQTNSYVAVDVPLDGPAVGVAAGGGHTCALMRDGSVRCWGGIYANGVYQYGLLGDGRAGGSLVAVAVADVHDAVQIIANQMNTCVLTRVGTIRCWGMCQGSRFGLSHEADPLTPALVAASEPATQISTGGVVEDQLCALLVSGKIQCWRSLPLDAQVGGSNVQIAVGSGGGDMCAVKTDGTYRCTHDDYVPDPDRLTGLTQISAGLIHRCVLFKTGAVGCWGDNEVGQLGNRSIQNTATSVVAPTGLSATSQLVTNYDTTCAILTSGAVRCWGWDTAKQIGPFDPGDQVHHAPTAVPGFP